MIIAYSLVWNGMNGVTFTVKAETAKEAKIALIEEEDLFPCDLSDIKVVGRKRVV